MASRQTPRCRLRWCVHGRSIIRFKIKIKTLGYILCCCVCIEYRSCGNCKWCKYFSLKGQPNKMLIYVRYSVIFQFWTVWKGFQTWSLAADFFLRMSTPTANLGEKGYQSANYWRSACPRGPMVYSENMMNDALALYLWSCSVSWCMTEGWRIATPHPSMSVCGLGRIFYFLLYYCNLETTVVSCSRCSCRRVYKKSWEICWHTI